MAFVHFLGYDRSFDTWLNLKFISKNKHSQLKQSRIDQLSQPILPPYSPVKMAECLSLASETSLLAELKGSDVATTQDSQHKCSSGPQSLIQTRKMKLFVNPHSNNAVWKF